MLVESLRWFSIRLDVLRKRTTNSLRFKNEAFIILERYCNQLLFSTACCQGIKDTLAKFANAVPVDVYNSYAYIDISVATLWERSIQHFLAFFTCVHVFIFLSRPGTSNRLVDFSTDGSSRPDRIVTIRRDICSFPGSSTPGSKAYFVFKLHDPTSGESGRQQQWTTRLSSCILDMCANDGVFQPTNKKFTS